MKKRLTSISGIFIVVVLVLIGITYTLKNVSAVVISGTEGGGGNSGCYKAQVEGGKKPGSVFWDTCFGGTWMRYPADSDSIVIPGQGSVKGGTVTGCKEAGFYYRLALLKFNTNGSLNSEDFTSTGQQVGLWQAHRFIPEGGNTSYRYDSNEYEWNNMKTRYELARANGGDANGNTWSEISWFCWSDDWDDGSLVSDAQFTSTSSVSADGSSSTSAKDGETSLYVDTEDYGGTITATFWHNLQYNPGTAITEELVSTKWTADKPEENVWSTPGNAVAESPKLAVEEVEITIPKEGESLTVCRKISYEPKYITVGPDGVSGSGNEDSKACIIINGEKNETDIVGEGHFWSNTTVEIPTQNDVPGYTATAEQDEFVEVKFSTDYPTTKVTFYHNMFYDDELWNPAVFNGSDSDVFDDICSQYDVMVSGSGGVNEIVESSKLCTESSDANKGKELARRDYEITLEVGEQAHICQEINHDGATVVIQRIRDDGHYRYIENSRSGYGWSQACVTIDRPGNPPDNDEEPRGPSSTATAKSSIMFAGENATIGWNTEAKTLNTRRLQESKAIAYLVPASVNHSDSISAGTLSLRQPDRKNSGPCDWYTNKTSAVWCGVVDGLEETGIHSSVGDGGSHTFTEQRTIVVPDEVGYKYCNSYGYRWEYWYSISKNGVDNWQKNEGKDYWTNYDATCRTIAKKPSVAVWNGGVQTDGGIITSLSPRHTSIKTDGPEKANNTFDVLYGSWAEYLAVVHGESIGFASGAALSLGSSDSSTQDIFPGRSTLTISNVNANLGWSGVTSNTALRNRLVSYLKSKADPFATLDTGDIVSISGTLNITENIERGSNALYPTIYDIPQKVIFVDGDVNISGNVTRIDAWIIATGKLDTCSDYSTGATETSAKGYTGTATCDKQLLFTGPIFASRVDLHRSYGSDPILQKGRQTPGEIFNLSAINYMWAYAQAGRYKSSYTEAYARELAPRY